MFSSRQYDVPRASLDQRGNFDDSNESEEIPKGRRYYKKQKKVKSSE
jgi:hypothetical protein